MQLLVPCIWFDDQAEEAARFYAQTFPRGAIVATSHYPQSGTNPSGKPPGSVLTVELEIDGQRFTALNGGPMFTPNPSVSFFVQPASPADADALFAKLADGGEVLMPIAAYPWSERYGWVKDRFGVSWQVMVSPTRIGVTPCLMFSGAQHGRAEEALQLYSRVFPGAQIEVLDRYAEGEGPVGTVKHGRVRIGDQRLVAMDSHLANEINFSEALSLQVMCDTQAEIDRYWAALADGGAEGPCGWLKDRFGFSWQIVPTSMVEWITSEDTVAKDRAFQAMLKMKKLDIAALRAAFEGR